MKFLIQRKNLLLVTLVLGMTQMAWSYDRKQHYACFNTVQGLNNWAPVGHVEELSVGEYREDRFFVGNLKGKCETTLSSVIFSQSYYRSDSFCALFTSTCTYEDFSSLENQEALHRDQQRAEQLKSEAQRKEQESREAEKRAEEEEAKAKKKRKGWFS